MFREWEDYQSADLSGTSRMRATRARRRLAKEMRERGFATIEYALDRQD